MCSTAFVKAKAVPVPRGAFRSEPAVDLDNYNWVNDPGPHPGVRGLGADDGGYDEDEDRLYPGGAAASGAEYVYGLGPELADNVLDEFEGLMTTDQSTDQSTVNFLQVLVSELKDMRGNDQQSR